MYSTKRFAPLALILCISYLYNLENHPIKLNISQTSIYCVFKQVVLSDEIAFVEKLSFWHKNENAYDQMHSPCDFIKPWKLQRFPLY